MSGELDHAITKFFRSAFKQKAAANLDQLDRQALQLAERIRNSELANEIASVAKRVIEMTRPGRGGSNSLGIVKLLSEFNSRQWPCSAEVLFLASLSQLYELDTPQLVSLAPTSKALSTLCKKLPATRKTVDEIAARSPEEWLQTATADWLFQHAKIPRLETAFIAALQLDKRATGLQNVEELLQSAAQRDKKGIFLFSVLDSVNDSGSLARFASVILAKPKIAATYLSVIRSPKGQKKMRDRLPKFLQALVSASLAVPGQSQLFRTTASLLMVGIISDIMISHPPEKPLPPSAMNAFNALDELETAANSDQDKSSTWVLHNLQRPSAASTESKISLSAARILKIAFEQTERGANTLQVLEAAAFNFGLRPIDEPDLDVTYDPRVHEDTTGGLHPGDTVKVLRKGWSLDGTPVIRAKVIHQAS